MSSKNVQKKYFSEIVTFFWPKKLKNNEIKAEQTRLQKVEMEVK